MVSSQPPGHWDRVSLAVRTQLLSNPPDMWLVSSEGFSLPTYTSLLTLHSPLIKALLSSTSTSSTFSLSLPVPALPIQLLISLLSQGSVSHHVPFNPLQVLEAAELLGIDIDIHVSNEQTTPLQSSQQSPKSENLVKEEVLAGDVKLAVTKEEHDGTLQCKICDHTASRKSNLNQHTKMIHSTNSPLYKCPSLGCIFKTKEKYYMRSHNEAKHKGVRFDCSLCQYQTPYKKSLRRHIERKHTSGTTPFA